MTVIELNDIEFENSIQEVSYAEAYLKRNGNTRENNLPDFKGKLIILYTSNAPRAVQDGILLELSEELTNLDLIGWVSTSMGLRAVLTHA